LGRKVHPLGFRTGIIRDWQARWYADKQYSVLLAEDMKIRQAIKTKYADAGISSVEVERQSNEVSVAIHTARPGVVIGRGGQRVDEMRVYLEGIIGKKVRLNIQEIRQPELDAFLVGRAIAEQFERRVSYRRAMKQAIFRTIQAGAKGIRVSCAGRLGGAEIARRQTMHQGRVPLHTLRADIDYGLTEAHTTLGRIGIKVWIYKGEILPEAKAEGAEEEEVVEGVESVAEEELAPVAESEEKAEAVSDEVIEEAEAPVAEADEEVKAEVVETEEEKASVEDVVTEISESVPEVVEEEEVVESVVEEKKAPVAKRKKKAEAVVDEVIEEVETPLAEADEEVKSEVVKDEEKETPVEDAVAEVSEAITEAVEEVIQPEAEKEEAEVEEEEVVEETSVGIESVVEEKPEDLAEAEEGVAEQEETKEGTPEELESDIDESVAAEDDSSSEELSSTEEEKE